MNRKNNFLKAVANVRGNEDFPQICGQVIFCQKKNSVTITAVIKNLPTTDSGFFGFHIHEGNSCDGENFANTGSHYNPSDNPHPAHAGDLPPLILCNGGSCQIMTTDRFTVKEIIGRTVIIHSIPDDFNSQPSGNSGTKIACGVICRA